MRRPKENKGPNESPRPAHQGTRQIRRPYYIPPSSELSFHIVHKPSGCRLIQGTFAICTSISRPGSISCSIIRLCWRARRLTWTTMPCCYSYEYEHCPTCHCWFGTDFIRLLLRSCSGAAQELIGAVRGCPLRLPPVVVRVRVPSTSSPVLFRMRSNQHG